MREIEFRGYDGAEWVYGTAVNYDKYTNTWYLLEHGGPDDDWIPVGRVGQYTGLKDKDDDKIYEGDYLSDDENFDWKVIFKDGAYYAESNELMAIRLLSEVNLHCQVAEVIY
ncbi:YopX family protein [Shouchella tritolerans]|uniref:YopX family protein n=1 Tax=Shouchella tritolerans TaxID=2979466 RepID=UPI0021E6DFEA|nr:YopX family protein [Shouchella tritolerans]